MVLGILVSLGFGILVGTASLISISGRQIADLMYPKMQFIERLSRIPMLSGLTALPGGFVLSRNNEIWPLVVTLPIMLVIYLTISIAGANVVWRQWDKRIGHYRFGRAPS